MKPGPTLPPWLAPWQARWARQARRIDALSLRERVVLFLAIAAVLAALFDSLILSPLQARATQRSDAVARQSAEIKALRDGFVSASRDSGAPSAPLQAEYAAATQERARLDAALAASPALRAEATDPKALPAVLERLLAQHPGLSLNRLALLDSPGPRASEPGLPGLSWQGVELQVEGPYNALVPYIRALEQQLPGLQWGELRLQGSGQEAGGATRLQAQLYLLRRPS